MADLRLRLDDLEAIARTNHSGDQLTACATGLEVRVAPPGPAPTPARCLRPRGAGGPCPYPLDDHPMMLAPSPTLEARPDDTTATPSALAALPPATEVSTLALRSLKAWLEELAGAVDSTRADAGFRAALDAMSRFWSYSFLNQFFIQLQCPRATRVTGRRAWEALGRRVKPGARAIHVLAPSRRTGGAVRFHGVEVFDLSQTRGRRLPTLELSLRGGTRHVRSLERAAIALGIQVVEARLPAHVGGLSKGGVIELQQGLRGRERASVLVHELAHELLHQAERRRAAELRRPGPRRTHAEVETEAEATSYVVLRALGLPSRAPTYIAWRGGTGLGVYRSMRRVLGAARAILEAAGDNDPRRAP